MNEGWRRVTICLKEEEYLALRREAGSVGVSMSVFIREMLRVNLDVDESEKDWIVVDPGAKKG